MSIRSTLVATAIHLALIALFTLLAAPVVSPLAAVIGAAVLTALAIAYFFAAGKRPLMAAGTFLLNSMAWALLLSLLCAGFPGIFAAWRILPGACAAFGGSLVMAAISLIPQEFPRRLAIAANVLISVALSALTPFAAFFALPMLCMSVLYFFPGLGRDVAAEAPNLSALERFFLPPALASFGMLLLIALGVLVAVTRGEAVDDILKVLGNLLTPHQKKQKKG